MYTNLSTWSKCKLLSILSLADGNVDCGATPSKPRGLGECVREVDTDES